MTESNPLKRRLAAILAADIAGYSRLMGGDEAATVRDLKDHQAAVLPLVADHGGRIIDTAGDGILAEFPSVIEAAACALDIQAVMASRNQPVPESRRMRFRIGINLGDVIYDDSRIYGDGINVAARLEGLAEPGGILVSHAVYEQVRDRLPAAFDDLGVQSLKNIARAVHVYRARPKSAAATTADAGPVPTDRSIAVLAFVDMSPQKDQEYVSDGIAEELLNLLSQVTQLRVIARTSSFSFKGQNVSIDEIARRLNVAHVLEGSVRKAGSRVRVTAQLIRATDSAHLWSATYDRSLEDIFAVQDEIAAEVVEQLKIKLLASAPRATETDPSAYALFLQARELARQNTPAGFAEALALVLRALEIAPDYAPGWTLLSAIHSARANYALVPVGEGYRQAQLAANQALAINPCWAAAHAQLGYIARTHDRDLAAAARHLDRALALAPSDLGVLGSAAMLLRSLGRREPTLAVLQHAVGRDPANAALHFNLGIFHFMVRCPDRALKSLRTALALAPGMMAAQALIGLALLEEGRLDEALAAARREPDEGHRLIALAMILHSLRRVAESDAALAATIRKFASDSAYNIAYVMAWRGEADQAFEWLEKAATYSDPGLSEIAVQPEFRALYDDPRWLPFLHRIGMAPDQLAAIPFQVRLPDQPVLASPPRPSPAQSESAPAPSAILQA